MPVSSDLTPLVERPVALTENPVHTFYEGGLLWRRFRRSSELLENRWAEDWVASCIEAGQRAPDGTAQGLSLIETADGRPVPLRTLVQEAPEAMLGKAAVARWGADTRIQVKLVAPRARVPLHTHPDAEFARRHFHASCGKAEAWIILEAPGTAEGPAYAGIGFKDGVTEAAFLAAVQAQDSAALLDLVHRTTVQPGDVIFVRPGVPHYISGGTFFIEVQEPADLGILAEWRGFIDGPAAAGGGLDPATAMSCFRVEPRTRADALGEAFQRPRTLRQHGSSEEIAMLEEDAAPFFEAQMVIIRSSYEPEEGRYYEGVVASGLGHIEGSGWRQPVRQGDTFVCAASLAHRFRAEGDVLRIIRAFGPRL
jgi:mannose-6-phosphate isomerase